MLSNHYLNPNTGKLATVPGSPGSALSDFQNVSLYSVGVGLVSTTINYMRLSIALSNGGVLDGNRIFGEKTIKYMATNHLTANLQTTGSSEQATFLAQATGLEFGLVFTDILYPVLSVTMNCTDNYFWRGAAGTTFWINPQEDIVAIAMMLRIRSPQQFRPDLHIST